MYPVLFEWGPLIIQTNNILLLIGAFIALWHLGSIMKKKRVNYIHFFSNSFFTLFLTTLIGSRIGGVIENWNDYFYFADKKSLYIFIALSCICILLLAGIFLYFYCMKTENTVKKIDEFHSLKEFWHYIETNAIVPASFLLAIYCCLLFFYFPEQFEIFYIWDDNLQFYSGLFVFIFFLFFLTKKQKIDFWKILDFTIFPMLIIFMFSSLGDLFAGENYGTPPELTFLPTITFESPAVPFVIPVHPVQIYAIVIYIILFIFGKYFDSKKHLEGTVALFIFLLYFISEFFLDFLRGTPVKKIFEDYKITQVYSLIFLLATIGILFWRSHKKMAFRKF